MERNNDVAGKELMVYLISTLMRYREGMLSKKEAYDEAKFTTDTLKKHRDMRRLYAEILCVRDDNICRKSCGGRINISRN